MKPQPIPADQLQSRSNRLPAVRLAAAVQFDAHGRRRLPSQDALTASTTAHASAPPSASREGRKRPADDSRDAQQTATSIEYKPNLVKRQRRESPQPVLNGEYYDGRGSADQSSADLLSGQIYRSGHGNIGRRGSERVRGSPPRPALRGGRGGRNSHTNSRNPYPPAPRDHGRDRGNRLEQSDHHGQQRHQPPRDQSHQTKQNWQSSHSNLTHPLPPGVNSSASTSTSTAWTGSSSTAAVASSSAPRIDPQQLPLPLIPDRLSHGPSEPATMSPPSKPTQTAAPKLLSRSTRSPSASSTSCTIFSDSDDDEVVDTGRVASSSNNLVSLFNEDDDAPSPRVELQYNHSRLPASTARTSAQFNRRTLTASGPTVSSAGTPPAPPPPRTRASTASSATGVENTRHDSSIAFPEINYPSYSAGPGNASGPASGSRRASIDVDNSTYAQLTAAMSAQHERYLDLTAQLGELDDRAADLDKQISEMIAAKKEVDAMRRELMLQLRAALDEDPIATLGSQELPQPARSAAATPPAVPRQTASGSAARSTAMTTSSPPRSLAPATGTGSASSAPTTPSPLTVTRTNMTDKITTRKPRALAYHPQRESDLVAAAFMDGCIRFFDTSRHACALLQHCPIASTDPANPGQPGSSPRLDAMRFVGNNHLVSIHLKNADGAQMSMITIDRQVNGTRALSTKHHHFGISLYDREISAIASDRNPATYRFATAGKSELHGWRVHLWSLRQPIVAPDDDAKYPHVLLPTDHFQTYDVPATHTSHVHSMILDDNNLFTSGFDGRLQWIDLTVQQPIFKAQLKGKKVTQILNSPTNPHLLYVACADSTAQFRIIDRRLVGSNTEPISQVVFGYDMDDNNLSSTIMSAVDPHTGMHFVSGSSLSDQRGTVLSWDLRFISSHRPKTTYWEPTERMQLGHSGKVDVIQFSPHSHSMATLGLDYKLGLHSLA